MNAIALKVQEECTINPTTPQIHENVNEDSSFWVFEAARD